MAGAPTRVPLIAALLAAVASSSGVAPEPWLPLNGGSFSGRAQPSSPDPLVSYVWPLASTNSSQLQLFSIAPTACTGTPASSFGNTSGCAYVETLAPTITVRGAGTLTIDFGVEFPGWVEFDSPDLLDADARALVVGISEYSVVDYVGGFKQDTPKRYGTCSNATPCTFRLETNTVGPELYEGVRYAFLTLASAPSAPFTISGLRAVSQAKPVNYIGSFSAPGDPLLERVWYASAYTVRATLQSGYMGSILMNRGDRFSWAGDAHPTQATSMVVFANHEFVFKNIDRGKSDCQGIATYCLYIVLSISDYWLATGNASAIVYFTPSVQEHLEQAANSWENPQGLRFVGWDDRTGSGFANNTTPETQSLYRLLAIRAWREAAAFFNDTGNVALATRYTSLADNRTADIRAMGDAPWWRSFGLHAGADAVNAGFLTPTEAAGIAGGAISDIVQLPSQSNFNQYFILQALSGLGQLDRGVESIRAIWGPLLSLGATTFWETSHPSAATIFPPGPPAPPAEQSGWVSLCHPWSSGPTPWVAKWVTGIRPLTPGYTRTLLAPHIAHSMSGVAGSAATVHGPISLSITPRTPSSGGVAVMNISLPAGVEVAIVHLSSVLCARIGLLTLPHLSDADAEVLKALSSIVIRSREGEGEEGDETLLTPRIVYAADAPLVEEGYVPRGRAPSLEMELRGGTQYRLTLSVPVLAAPVVPSVWAPLGSPFPPPAWPGHFMRADTTTQGNWRGAYGGDGFVLIGYDVPRTSLDPFCGVSNEGDTMQLQCDEQGATISEIVFAAFGTPAGVCPAFTHDVSCDALNSSAVFSSACVGKRACSVPITNAAFGGDPCPGTSKTAAVVARCSTGGGSQPGSDKPPIDRAVLPPYVTSARVVTYDGFCAARGSWSNGTGDVRALEDPGADRAAPRHLGFMQPCGCPTAPFDILLTNAAKASNKCYRLSLYFVDFAPSPTCSGLDGTARSQEVYLLTGYPELAPATPRQALATGSFADGVWLSYQVCGDIRVRISTVRGDMAVLSAVTFDEV